MVAPGFIDMHPRGGLTMLHAPPDEPKVWRGVTTDLIGLDGKSHAPLKSREDRHRIIEIDSCLNGERPMPAERLRASCGTAAG